MIKKRTNLSRIASLCLLAFLSGCAEIKTPEASEFYAESKPPDVQELRWSNGAKPKTLDPARAAAAPETDVVRSLYEGLTEIDPITLVEIPAVAESWSHADGFKTWTFQLRLDARWSNGRRVTASDFVASWRRAFALGDKVPNRHLLRNIVGLSETKPEDDTIDFEIADEAELAETTDADETMLLKDLSPEDDALSVARKIAGLEAVNETTLRVRLESPDKDFPKLVAAAIFRPVFGEGKVFEATQLPAKLVTNGPFVLDRISANAVALKRSDQYWNRSNVALERVRFVPFYSAEEALSAYRNGEIDVVTNAEFEPLALKLLEPFQDFRRTTHSALNFYEFNTGRAPFNDRRVREALAISIDRERLSAGELEGATRSAASFLPLGDKPESMIEFDAKRAKELLGDAGFPNGENFPRLRLLINRNDTQQRIARTVARMWKQNINIETEVSVKNSEELDAARTALDYDLVRRGVVLPTLDEAVNLESIFGRTARVASEAETVLVPPVENAEESEDRANESRESEDSTATEVFTEEDALYEMNAIPLYFPTSYSLVKPYVQGFEINGLDAPILSAVIINNEWRGQ